MVQGGDGERELRHGMEGGWTPVQDLLDEFRNGGAGGPVLGEGVDLLLRWDFARHKEPEETLWQWLLAPRRLGEEVLDLRDGLAAEANALIYVDDKMRLVGRDRERATDQRRGQNRPIVRLGGRACHYTYTR